MSDSRYKLVDKNNGRYRLAEEQQKPEQTFDESIFQRDPISKVLNIPKIMVKDMGESLGTLGNTLMEQGWPAIGQLVNDPGRAYRNVAAGIPQLANRFANAPHATPEYLQHLGILSPEMAQRMASRIPKYHDFTNEIKKMYGVEGEQPGDVVWQGTTKYADMLLPLLKGAIPAVKGAGKMAVAPIKAIPEAISDFKKSRGIPETEAALAKTEQERGQAEQKANSMEAMENQAKSTAHIEAGSHNPDVLQRKVNQSHERLKALDEELTGIPEPKKGPEAIQPSSAETFSHQNNMDFVHGEAKKALNDIESGISEHLNKRAAHDVRAAARLDEIQEAKKSKISDKYKEVEKEMEGKNVDVNNEQLIKDKTNELMGHIKAGDAHSPEAKAILGQLEKLSAEEKIPANEYLIALRAVRDYSRDARKKAYTHGINAEERDAAMKEYNELDEKADQMATLLENSIDKSTSAKLKEANKEWKEQVIPLYKNPIYQSLHFKGQMPDNIMKALRGTEPGNVLMQDMIKSDSDLLRNVVGQRYAHKPHALHEANETEMDYINKMPELQNAMESHKHAGEVLSKAEQASMEAKIKHKETVLKEKKSEKETAAIEKENARNQTLRDKVKAEKDKIDTEISTMERHHDNLKRVSEDKKFSFEERAKKKLEAERIKKQLDEKKKSRDRLYSKGKNLGKTAIALGVGSSGIYGIKKALHLFE